MELFDKLRKVRYLHFVFSFFSRRRGFPSARSLWVSTSLGEALSFTFPLLDQDSQCTTKERGEGDVLARTQDTTHLRCRRSHEVGVSTRFLRLSCLLRSSLRLSCCLVVDCRTSSCLALLRGRAEGHKQLSGKLCFKWKEKRKREGQTNKNKKGREGDSKSVFTSHPSVSICN